MLRAHAGGLGSINYSQLQSLQYAYLFASGAVAITAMVLPGISGSSILLIAGVYLPTIQAVHSLMGLQLAVLPGLCTPGFGVLAGVAISISAIRAAPGAEYGDLPACRLCVGRYRAAGAGRCENDDGT